MGHNLVSAKQQTNSKHKIVPKAYLTCSKRNKLAIRGISQVCRLLKHSDVDGQGKLGISQRLVISKMVKKKKKKKRKRNCNSDSTHLAFV